MVEFDNELNGGKEKISHGDDNKDKQTLRKALDAIEAAGDNKEAQREGAEIWNSYARTKLKNRSADLDGFVFNTTPETPLTIPVHLDFERAKLRGAVIENVAMTGANFDLAKMRGIKITGSSICLSEINYADMSESRLTDVNLSATSITHTNLNGLDSRGLLTLEATRIRNTELIGATISAVKMDEFTQLVGVNASDNAVDQGFIPQEMRAKINKDRDDAPSIVSADNDKGRFEASISAGAGIVNSSNQLKTETTVHTTQTDMTTNYQYNGHSVNGNYPNSAFVSMTSNVTEFEQSEYKSNSTITDKILQRANATNLEAKLQYWAGADTFLRSTTTLMNVDQRAAEANMIGHNFSALPRLSTGLAFGLEVKEDKLNVMVGPSFNSFSDGSSTLYGGAGLEYKNNGYRGQIDISTPLHTPTYGDDLSKYSGSHFDAPNMIAKIELSKDLLGGALAIGLNAAYAGKNFSSKDMPVYAGDYRSEYTALMNQNHNYHTWVNAEQPITQAVVLDTLAAENRLGDITETLIHTGTHVSHDRQNNEVFVGLKLEAKLDSLAKIFSGKDGPTRTSGR